MKQPPYHSKAREERKARLKKAPEGSGQIDLVVVGLDGKPVYAGRSYDPFPLHYSLKPRQ